MAEPNDVLAFLLGSTPPVAASTHEMPPLEPVSNGAEPPPGSVETEQARTIQEAPGSPEAEHEDDCAAPGLKDLSSEKKQVGSAKKTKTLKPSESRPSKTSRQAKKESSHVAAPTLEEFLLVGCVATVLVAYLAACVYSFSHPLVVPLPDYRELYTAYDISNVSIATASPLNDSAIAPQGVVLEWEIRNFPTGALRQYGAEVFRYRVSLDDEELATEIGFMALAKEADERGDEAINRTVTFPIPIRRFALPDDQAPQQFKIRLEVTIPVPGLIEEFKTFEQSVVVSNPAAPDPAEHMRLVLSSPEEGATFEVGESIVLEYSAVNVHELQVLVDNDFFMTKTFVRDGNLLLRGLGLGLHSLEVKALSEGGKTTASSTLHVNVIERQDTLS